MTLNMKWQDRIESVIHKRWVITLMMAILAFLWAEQCTTSLFFKGVDDPDSSVFRYIGYAMGKGLVMYKDAFDHKGPLLYVINYLGYMIDPEIGVWVIEYLAMLITAWFVFKIAQKSAKNDLGALCATVVSLSLLNNFLQGGNFTEEYAMPLIAVALYVFVDYFLCGKTTCTKIAICGLCGGGVLLLRPNMAVTWLVFPIFVVINELRQKNGKRLITYSVFFVLGVLAVLLPFMVYLIRMDAMVAFIDAYFKFNVKYSAVRGSLFGVLTAIHFFLTPVVLLAIMAMVAGICTKRITFLDVCYSIYIPLSLVFICVSGHQFFHYGMILVPLVAYPIGKIFSKEGVRLFGKMGVVTMIVIVVVTSYLMPAYDCVKHILGRDAIVEDKNIEEIVEYVRANTEEDERITVVGSTNVFYLKCDRLSASKYSYQWPVANVDENIRRGFFEEIGETKPAALIVPRVHEEFNGLSEYIEKYEYSEVFSNEQYKVLQR